MFIIIQVWERSSGEFALIRGTLPVVKEPCTFLAALCHHDASPGLPRRLLAALCFNGEGVLVVADWAMMNSANLLSFELVLL